jgi:hypothetical protein
MTDLMFKGKQWVFSALVWFVLFVTVQLGCTSTIISSLRARPSPTYDPAHPLMSLWRAALSHFHPTPAGYDADGARVQPWCPGQMLAVRDTGWPAVTCKKNLFSWAEERGQYSRSITIKWNIMLTELWLSHDR